MRPCVPSRWTFLSRPLGFFRMIAYDSYEYEAFRFAPRTKKGHTHIHTHTHILKSEDMFTGMFFSNTACVH